MDIVITITSDSHTHTDTPNIQFSRSQCDGGNDIDIVWFVYNCPWRTSTTTSSAHCFAGCLLLCRDTRRVRERHSLDILKTKTKANRFVSIISSLLTDTNYIDNNEINCSAYYSRCYLFRFVRCALSGLVGRVSQCSCCDTMMRSATRLRSVEIRTFITSTRARVRNGEEILFGVSLTVIEIFIIITTRYDVRRNASFGAAILWWIDISYEFH